MLKADRDQVMGNLQGDDRTNSRRFIDDYQTKRKATSTADKSVGQIPAQEILVGIGDDLTPTIREAMEAVVVRDEMGPHVGDMPPDFSLKRIGSKERVQLSNFKGQQPVALIFGSYT